MKPVSASESSPPPPSSSKERKGPKKNRDNLVDTDDDVLPVTAPAVSTESNGEEEEDLDDSPDLDDLDLTPIVTRGESSTLMDLIETLDLEEAAAAVAAAEVLAGSSRSGSPAENRPLAHYSYFTPRKSALLESITPQRLGLTPLAELIHPTMETPSFNSMPTTPLDDF